MKPDYPIDPQRELSATMREGAKGLRELYVALVREGFSSDEAIKLVAECVRLGGGQR